MDARGLQEARSSLIAGQLLFVAAALAAYGSRADFTLLAVIVFMPTLWGALRLRRSLPGGPRHDRADRIVSFSIGAMTFGAVLVIIPYLSLSGEGTYDPENSITRHLAYPAIGMLAMGLGMLLAGQAAAEAFQAPSRLTYGLGIVHAVALAVAGYFVLTGQGPVQHEVRLQGFQTPTWDLVWTPILATVPCAAWAWLIGPGSK